jgi:urea transport system ATP-binding protein
LILDDSTQKIQPSIVKKIEEVMLSLKGKLSVLLLEQYFDFAQTVSDDYIVMMKGQCVSSVKGYEMEVNNARALVAI